MVFRDTALLLCGGLALGLPTAFAVSTLSPANFSASKPPTSFHLSEQSPSWPLLSPSRASYRPTELLAWIPMIALRYE